jgi:hypothetical protein
MKVSRLSIKKRDSIMNRRGVLIAEEQESNREAAIIEAASVEIEVLATGGSYEES